MTKRTTLVLGLVAAAMALFILTYERHTLPTSAVSGRGARLLPRFVSEEVERLVIERQDDDAPVVLERERDDELAVGEWKMREPWAADADADAVSSLLSTLDWADPLRTLEDVSEADRSRFGLDAPRITLLYTVANEEHRLVIASEDPTGEGVYVQLGEPDVAYVARSELYEALDHDASHYRSKDVFSDLAVTRATGLELGSGEGALELEQRAGQWWIARPHEVRARDSDVRRLLSDLDGLEATRFLGRDQDLGTLHRIVHVRLPAPVVSSSDGGLAGAGLAAGSAEPGPRATVRVGEPCPGHDDERLAQRDDGPIVCVRNAAVESLAPDAAALRQRTLVASGLGEVARLEIAQGTTRLVVERTSEGEGYRYDLDGEAGDAAATAVESFVEALEGLQASEIIVAPGEPELRSRGLAVPQATLRIVGDGGRETRIELGAEADPESVWVRREGEAVVLRVPASAARSFEPEPVRFRSRQLLSKADAELTAIDIEGSVGAQRLERTGAGELAVVAPTSAPADPILARDLVRRLGSLSALRFIASTARPEHGLGSPRAMVRATFEGGEADATHVLRIGAATPDADGFFAQLDEDPAVFAVPVALEELVSTALASREALAVSPDAVTGAVLEAADGRLALERAEGKLAGPGGNAASAEAQAAVEALGGLRAESARYVDPDGARPKAQLTVRLSLGEQGNPPRERTLAIGPETGDGPARRVRAWRADLPGVELLFAPEAVRPLLLAVP